MTDSANDSRLYFYVAYGVLALLVFISVIFAMSKASEGTSFNERLMSTDLALTTDLIMGLPGNFNIIYTLNNGSSGVFYDSSFSNPCYFNVIKTNTPLYSSTYIDCALNNNLNIIYLDFGSYTRLFLNKDKSSFEVKGE